jgi:glycerol-3-phosphate dehydrogenase
MGPCQGGFCTFRAAGMVAERLVGGASADPADAAGAADAADAADRALGAFMRERHRGTRPIAYGRQLQEWAMVSALYEGTLGAGALLRDPVATPEPEIDTQTETDSHPVGGHAVR